MKALIFRRTVTVFDPVKPLQIGGCLRRSDGIVGGDGVFHQAQIELLHLCAKLRQLFRRAQNGLSHLFVKPLRKIIPGDTDPKAPHILRQGRRKIRLPLQAGGIHHISAADRFQQGRTVRHISAQGTDLIQGRAIGDQPVSGYRSISGFHAHHAAEACRLTDGAARVASQRKKRFFCRHRRRGTAGRASRHMRRIPWISGYTEGAGFRGGTHGKFIHVGLTDENAARFFQFFCRKGVIGRNEIRKDL